MTEPRPDDRPGEVSVNDPGLEALDGPTDQAGGDVERRAFLRQLTGEAIVTTARLAGLSAVVRRSLFAAGEAVTRDLDPAESGEPTDPAVRLPSALADGSTRASAGLPREPAVIGLTARQEAMLDAAASAVLAVNDPAGAPHLTSSTFHWDGAVVRMPSELLSARVAWIDSDPRVSVLIEDATSGGWVAMTGVATVVSGEAVEPEMLTILGKYLSDDDAARRWAEMRPDGDRVVIRVRPIHLVWRLD